MMSGFSVMAFGMGWLVGLPVTIAGVFFAGVLGLI
jgi:hypothetical protein